MRLFATILLTGLPVAVVTAATDHEEPAALAVIQARCGSCHDHSLATAKPAALAVFDVADVAWWTRLSDEQLVKINGRMSDKPGPERAAVSAFVTAEQERRR